MGWGDTFCAAWHAAGEDGRFFCAQLATGEHPVGVAAPGLRVRARPDVEGWIARTTATTDAWAADPTRSSTRTLVNPSEGIDA
jgi:hypothetical protein